MSSFLCEQFRIIKQEMEGDERRGRGDVHELADGPVGVVV